MLTTKEKLLLYDITCTPKLWWVKDKKNLEIWSNACMAKPVCVVVLATILVSWIRGHYL